MDSPWPMGYGRPGLGPITFGEWAINLIFWVRRSLLQRIAAHHHRTCCLLPLIYLGDGFGGTSAGLWPDSITYCTSLPTFFPIGLLLPALLIYKSGLVCKIHTKCLPSQAIAEYQSGRPSV